MDVSVTTLDMASIRRHLGQLVDILSDSVEHGAAIGFMHPVVRKDAESFWLDIVTPEVVAGRRVLLAALTKDRVVGTVQLITSLPPNQPHRCEIAKMIVHRTIRRAGIGRLLMSTALDHAQSMGKTLVTLDTRTGDAAEHLYQSVGFDVAGVIPDFAWDPDGRARHATTYMYRRL